MQRCKKKWHQFSATFKEQVQFERRVYDTVSGMAEYNFEVT